MRRKPPGRSCSSSATHSRNSGFLPCPSMSWLSDIVKPRSGALPRHCSLIALSCVDERVRRLGLADHLEAIACARPGARRPARPSSPAPSRLKLVALDDGLVAEIEAAQPASGVARQLRLAGRQEGDAPRALLAEVDELVQHGDRWSRAHRSDRPTRGRIRRGRCRRRTPRRRCRRRSSCHRAARSRRACRSRRAAPAGGRAPSRSRCAARAQRSGRKSRNASPTMPTIPSDQQGCREVLVEEPAVVGVRAADADQALDDRLQPAGERECAPRWSRSTPRLVKPNASTATT